MASSSQIRNEDAKRVKNEPIPLVVLTSDDEDDIVGRVKRDWVSAGLRVSNSVRDRDEAVNGKRERVQAVSGERERVQAMNGKRVEVVNGKRDMVDAVKGKRERVDVVNGKRVDAVNGRRERIQAVNGKRDKVQAVSGKRERVDAVNGNREKVKRGTGINGESKRVKRVTPSNHASVSAVNDDNAGGCEWIANVTRAIQNLKVKQTLHIPSWVVQDCLTNRTGIKIRSQVNNRVYDCTIRNPGRGKFERYITYGWYDFLLDHKPKVGDILLFDVKSPKLMVVDIIRRKRRSD